jgi:hypothetical protein
MATKVEHQQFVEAVYESLEDGWLSSTTILVRLRNAGFDEERSDRVNHILHNFQREGRAESKDGQFGPGTRARLWRRRKAV